VLFYNTTGSENTVSGLGAMQSNTTGGRNTVSGNAALYRNYSGSSNTVSGYYALVYNTTGNNNIAIGAGAGYYAPGENSNSIYIGSAGLGTFGGDGNDASGTIRIGDAGTQSSFFAAGVRGITTAASDAIPVVIDSNGQLGTVSSSLRFKEDVRDRSEASSGILRLRPVTFRYKQAFEDGLKPLDYGLIAEEVAEVYPDLVVKDKDGRIQTVQYQKLTPMLLNEVQKQHAEVQKLHDELDQQHLEAKRQNQFAQQQDETIRQLQSRLAALEALLPDKGATAVTAGR
jgi:hypothetical protein